ncbi:hypothetical protein IKG33_01050 [Candidatus Saccharibacteria bacterium]|nr:hypothetical protein [Candidatus Saccharibacteria bacterium]
MSILQEYEGHTKIIGKKKFEALLKYIKKCSVFYSDVIYNKKNWEEFDKWYREVYNNKYGKSSKGDKTI